MVSGRDPVLVNEPARGPARDFERIRKRKKKKGITVSLSHGITT